MILVSWFLTALNINLRLTIICSRLCSLVGYKLLVYRWNILLGGMFAKIFLRAFFGQKTLGIVKQYMYFLRVVGLLSDVQIKVAEVKLENFTLNIELSICFERKKLYAYGEYWVELVYHVIVYQANGCVQGRSSCKAQMKSVRGTSPLDTAGVPNILLLIFEVLWFVELTVFHSIIQSCYGSFMKEE